MYPLPQAAPRTADFRWEGPECVKNLFLDTVVQCPQEDGKKDGKGGKEKEKEKGGKKGDQRRRRLRAQP